MEARFGFGGFDEIAYHVARSGRPGYALSQRNGIASEFRPRNKWEGFDRDCDPSPPRETMPGWQRYLSSIRIFIFTT
jgi:hypothetical protein